MEKMSASEARKRKEIVANAEGYIKSILVGLRRFKNGSDVETDYVEEKFEKLRNTLSYMEHGLWH